MLSQELSQLPPGVYEEQLDDQRAKMIYRGLTEYSTMLYPNRFRLPASFFAAYEDDGMLNLGDGMHISNLLLALKKTLGYGDSTTLHWLDVGGGVGAAQSEYQKERRRDNEPLKVTTVNQDVVPDHPLGGIGEKTVADINDLARFKPELFVGDVCEATPDQQFEYITSVFSIPYWNDPLKGLVNMFNTLRPGGIMSVCTGTQVGWSNCISYADKSRTTSPVEDLIGTLDRAGIGHAEMYTIDSLIRQNYYRSPQLYSMTIHKNEAVSMQLNATLERIVKLPPKARSIAFHKIGFYSLEDTTELVSLIED